MLNPAGRVVMISGASRGIGAAIARRLHEAGYSLSLGLRRPGAAAVTGPSVLAVRWSAEEPASAKAWVAATAERFGRIDAVVNNAAISKLFRLEDEDESILDQMWEVNVKGPLRVIRAALPHLRESGAGRVVNVSSLSGKRVKNEGAGYAMTKHAVVALTHSVRLIGWKHGIRATALCPGFVRTDMTEKSNFPRDEMTRPEDLAELVAALLALPNNASVAELLVNCRFEEML
jgi:NAD(P)-dependent dehydrogenase (short-subunit alcohol dehydrogenase family)